LMAGMAMRHTKLPPRGRHRKLPALRASNIRRIHVAGIVRVHFLARIAVRINIAGTHFLVTQLASWPLGRFVPKSTITGMFASVPAPRALHRSPLGTLVVSHLKPMITSLCRSAISRDAWPPYLEDILELRPPHSIPRCSGRPTRASLIYRSPCLEIVEVLPAAQPASATVVTPARNVKPIGINAEISRVGATFARAGVTCTWISIKPGVTYSPRTFTTLNACAGSMCASTAAIFHRGIPNIANGVDLVLRVDHVARPAATGRIVARNQQSRSLRILHYENSRSWLVSLSHCGVGSK